MKESFVPKKLEVIKTPSRLIQSFFEGRTQFTASDFEVDVAVGRLLHAAGPSADLFLYAEDFAPESALKMCASPEVLRVLNSLRQRFFGVLSAEVPSVMIKQLDLAEDPNFDERGSSARWRSLGGVSPGIAELLPSKDLGAFRVKPDFWTGTEPFRLHTGAGGVSSPFLAEEHVFYTEGSGEEKLTSVTLAPDHSSLPVLGTHFDTIPQAVRLRALWQAMQGCEVLHRSGFIHGDVKPANIFCTDFGGQLFDFNIAVPIGSKRKQSGGSPIYLDEEVRWGFFRYGEDFQAERPARDVFAFGMSLGEVVNQDMNWSMEIYEGHGPLALYVQRTLKGSPYCGLIADMTHPKRNERPSLPEAINRLGRLIGLGEVKF